MNALQRLEKAIEQRYERKQGSARHAQQRAIQRLWNTLTRSWSYQQRYNEYERFTNDNIFYPPLWTESSAADDTYTSEGFWTLQQTTDGTWSYYLQAATHFENDTNANDSTLYRFGPVAWSSLDWSCDITYRFAVAADNAGSPGPGNDLAFELVYDPVSGASSLQTERTVSGAVTAGSLVTLNKTPLVMPLWFSIRIWNNTNRDVDFLWGNSPISQVGQVLWSSTFTLNIGQAHLVVSATRGIGDTRTSTLRLGGFDVWMNSGT